MLCFFLFLASTSSGQNVLVSGKVLDANEKLPVDYASVVLLKAADSTSAGFTFSEDDGGYHFKNIEPGSYVIQVFHTGFKLVSKAVTVASTDVVVGTLYLEASAERLSTALIEAKAIPVVIRGDTLVYNPNAFKNEKQCNG